MSAPINGFRKRAAVATAVTLALLVVANQGGSASRADAESPVVFVVKESNGPDVVVQPMIPVRLRLVREHGPGGQTRGEVIRCQIQNRVWPMRRADGTAVRVNQTVIECGADRFALHAVIFE